MDLNWADHIFVFLVGLVLPLRMLNSGAAEQLRELEFDSPMRLLLYYGNSAYLWVLAGIVALIWWLSGRDWDLLGLAWEPTQWPTASLIIALIFSILYLSDAIGEVITAEQRERTRRQMKAELGFLPTNGYEFAHYLVLAFSAAFCEEFVFRGYFIRYLQEFLGPSDPYETWAILLPAVSFALVHLYQGWKSVIKVGAMAIMFGFIFVQTGSIWWLILLHFLVDAFGGLLAWWLQSDVPDDIA